MRRRSHKRREMDVEYEEKKASLSLTQVAAYYRALLCKYLMLSPPWWNNRAPRPLGNVPSTTYWACYTGSRMIPIKCTVNQRWACATFFESAIAIPQLEGSTSAIAIPQLLKKCCSATLQFRNRNFFWSPQLQVRNFKSATWELQFRNFRHIFRSWNPVDSWGKKSEVKNLVLLSL